jgi:hypothetical protein
VPDEIGWDEALRLVRIIRSDPSSALAAEIEGWSHPVSRLEVVLMDLWDLTAAAATSKGKPPRYPRVWKAKGEATRHGNAAGLDPADVKRRLAEMAGRTLPPI